MCGIIGYVGPQAAGPILLEGLHRLEYRGYDSSGIAVLDRDGALAILKRAGKLAELRSHIEAPPPGQVGIGHTRWATHGDVVDLNAHPHVSSNGEVVVVHNGIVENYRALRDRLAAAGLRCTTQTDTEVIPQLISLYLRERDDFRAALQRTLAELQGGNAIVAMYRRQPDRLFAARLGNAGGIVLGFGGEEMFVASDLPALLPHTTRVRFLEEGEVAEITGGGARVWNREGAEVAVEPQTVSLNPLAAMKGPYRHFMLKEIREQPRALSDTIRGRAHLNPPGVWLEDLPYSDARPAADWAGVDHRHGQLPARRPDRPRLLRAAGRPPHRLRQRLRVSLPGAGAGPGDASGVGEPVGGRRWTRWRPWRRSRPPGAPPRSRSATWWGRNPPALPRARPSICAAGRRSAWPPASVSPPPWRRCISWPAAWAGRGGIYRRPTWRPRWRRC